MKEEKAKRYALTSLPEQIPEVASACIPLARKLRLRHVVFTGGEEYMFP